MIKIADDFMSITQIADALGITRQAVYLAIKSGKIKSESIGKIKLVSKEAFEAYKAQR